MSPELVHCDSVGTLSLFWIEDQVALAVGTLGPHCLIQRYDCLCIL